jgi:hypothetical protein
MNLIKRLINLCPPFWFFGFKGAGESGSGNEPKMTATFTAEPSLNAASAAMSGLMTTLNYEPDGI